MKRRLFLILLASILLITGCSYIEHTEGSNTHSSNTENEIIPEDTTSDRKKIKQETNRQTEDKDTESTDINTDGSLDNYKVSIEEKSSDKENDIEQYYIKDNTDTDKILNVHIIDVGQGDSILIQSDNRYMLIDAGERDKGRLVINYLESLGVKKLDYLIGTHPHSDHIGGLADVIRSFEIGKIIMPNVVHTTRTFENVLDAIADKGLRITKPTVGNEFTIGTAAFVIIAPNSADYNNLNNYSVGIKLINGENSFIFTGDAEIESENEILKNGISLDTDVLKLGHHGSSTSSSKNFLDALSPSISIISAGEGNQYGHPHVEILQTHKDRNIKLYRTDKQGTIILESDGNKVTVNKEPYEITKDDLDFTKSGTPSTDTGKKDKSDKNSAAIINNDTEVNKDSNDAKNIIVHITKTGARYHRSNCRHLKSDIEASLQEAIDKGLTPCKTCKPPTL